MTEVPFWFLWVNVAAIALGPILAVVVARYMEDRRTAYERRMSIFRDLMRYRRTILSPEYVGALNLVEVEFNKSREVITAWRNLYEHLHQPTHIDASLEVLRAWNDKADRLHALLIHSIARSSKLPLEQLDIIAGYAPRAWEEAENRKREVEVALLKILQGDSALAVQPANAQNGASPWPEAPN